MDMMNAGYERWCSMNEVCEYLSITRDTCLTWIEKRGMPGVKVGRTWRFKISEIDEWMRAGDAKNKDNIGVSDSIMEIFDITGLTDIFTIG